MALGKIASMIFLVLLSSLSFIGCGSGGGRVTITTPNISASSGSEETEGVVKALNEKA